MKSSKVLLTMMISALVLTLIGVFAGCGFLSVIISKLPEGGSEESGTLVTSSTARGTSLSLSSNGLEIARAQLTEEVAMGEAGTRTVLIYMCGTDLESDSSNGLAVADLREMVSAASNENLTVVVQTGGAKRWTDSSISARKISRFLVTNEGLSLLEELPQANMGAESTLEDFLVWGVTSFPAEKTDVIFWNHGSGSINGVCFDENYNYDSLTVQEIDQAFLAVFSKMTDKFETVGFDACLMSTVEVANVLASYARYMVASEESEAGTGWQYKTLLNALAANPSMSGEQLGRVVADSAYSSLVRENKKMYTMAVIDLTKVDDICIALDKTAEDMVTYVDGNSTAELVKLITQATNFGGNSRSEGYTNMVDLGDMMRKISTLIPSAENVLTAVQNAVIYKVEGSERTSVTGIAIYYPIKVQGSSEVRVFTNICVSPHYLAYLDKTVFGTSATGGTSGNQGNGGNHGNNGHNWEQWLQNGFDFWSFVDGFDAYWNDVPDVSGGDTYNVIDEDSQNVTLQLMCDPYLDKNGTYTVKMSGESLNYLVTVDYALFLKQNDGSKILIGSDVDVNLQYSGGVCVMTDQFYGKWIAMNDGQLIALEVVEETENYAVYAAPILLNGVKTTLRVKRIINGGTPVYEVLGAYNGISETGAASKSLTALTAGDEIIPLYYVYQADGSIGESQGVGYTVGEEGLVLGEVALQDGAYEYCFILTDTTGATYYTEATVYTIKGSAIYYTAEKTDTVSPYQNIWGQYQQNFGFNFFDAPTYGYSFEDLWNELVNPYPFGGGSHHRR